MNTHEEAAIMLREAREYIEKKGWVKGTYRAFDGRVCLLQALRDVDGEKHTKVVDAECNRIVLKHTLKTSIPTFNDAATTTKQDILDLLSACEAMERELASAAS